MLQNNTCHKYEKFHIHFKIKVVDEFFVEFFVGNDIDIH